MRLWFGYKSYGYLTDISPYYKDHIKGVWDTYTLQDTVEISDVIPSNIDINNAFYELNVTSEYIQFKKNVFEMNSYIPTNNMNVGDVIKIIEDLYYETI